MLLDYAYVKKHFLQMILFPDVQKNVYMVWWTGYAIWKSYTFETFYEALAIPKMDFVVLYLLKFIYYITILNKRIYFC